MLDEKVHPAHVACWGMWQHSRVSAADHGPSVNHVTGESRKG